MASFAGSWFHCLQATSQALQPMQRLVSVKKPITGCGGGACSLGPTREDTMLLRGDPSSCPACFVFCSERSVTIALLLHGRRPGRMLHVNALASSMLTFGSSTICARSLVILPVAFPWYPQWNGTPIW